MNLEQEPDLLSKKYKNTRETKKKVKKHWKNTENLIIKQKHIMN